ncbi:hypothetical protein FRC07_012766, partial [Ceratobasidium sp. 392]
MTSRYSDATSIYSQPETVIDDSKTPTRMTYSNLTMPGRRLSQLPPLPPSPQRPPDTPIAEPSAPLLPHSASSSRSQTPPGLGIPQSFAPFRPRPNMYPSPGPAQSRHGFAGVRESSSGYTPSVPSSIRSTPHSVRPQAAFLIPPDTASLMSFGTSGTSEFNDLDRYIGTAPNGHRPSTRLSTAYSLDVDPTRWETVNDSTESDDDLHSPDPRRDKTYDHHLACNARGIINAGCLFLTIIGMMMLL